MKGYTWPPGYVRISWWTRLRLRFVRTQVGSDYSSRGVNEVRMKYLDGRWYVCSERFTPWS